MIPERVIIAPSRGAFQPHPGVCDGTTVVPGDAIGEVVALGRCTTILSPFAGTIQKVLRDPGEILRCGQPIAWLQMT